MDVQLGIAGMTCALLALGHGAIGLRWVLPSLADERPPSTPFGPPTLTAGMIRFTWHVVTLVLVAFATLLLALAFATPADPITLVLRWLAAFWAAATAMAVWQVRRRPSTLARFPVPVLFALVAVLSWMSST